MAFSLDKNDELFTSLCIFGPTKICFARYQQLFCGKLEAVVQSYFVENLLFSKLLYISKKM